MHLPRSLPFRPLSSVLRPRFSFFRRLLFPVLCLLFSSVATAKAAEKFHLQEASIASTQSAILAKQVTSTQLVQLYLARIKTYNGPGVKEPNGILGVIETLPNAKQINAIATLNLRPATLKSMGFPAKMARSLTDPIDADPAMPDALEVAAAQDAHFKKTGKLIGPLHGVVMAIKDQYDTADSAPPPPPTSRTPTTARPSTPRSSSASAPPVPSS